MSRIRIENLNDQVPDLLQNGLDPLRVFSCTYSMPCDRRYAFVNDNFTLPTLTKQTAASQYNHYLVVSYSDGAAGECEPLAAQGAVQHTLLQHSGRQLACTTTSVQ